MPTISRIRRWLAVAAVATVGSALAGGAVADDAAEAQELVDRARLAFNDIVAAESFDLAREEMAKAKAVLIIPRLLKAGFILGGEGGSGVLVARAADGGWGQPAFYTMGSGSIGLQIGLKDSQVLFVVRTQKGLDAILDDQVKLGADVSVAAGPVGAGMSAATTTSAGADILSFALSRGAFGGAAFEGSVIAKRSALNAAYYGREVAPREIVVGGAVSNPGADALRQVLARF